MCLILMALLLVMHPCTTMNMLHVAEHAICKLTSFVFLHACIFVVKDVQWASKEAGMYAIITLCI